MHICILYQHYLRPGDAGHNRFNDYARIWSSLGHKVSVITGQASYMTGRKDAAYRGRLCVHEKDGDVDVYRMYVPDRANESFSRRAFSYLSFASSSALGYRRLERPSVLLCSSPPLFIGLGMLLIHRFSRVPMVFEVRDLWPESAITTGVVKSQRMIRLMYGIEKRCYAAATRLNVVTEAFRANILERGLADESKIWYIPNGVDVETQHPSLRSEQIREQLDWKGRYVVFYSGAHGLMNRVGQLIEAAKLLRKHPEILIATMGGGMELASLQQRVEDEGLTNIKLLGPRPREAMPAITASADACVAVLQRNDTFKTVYPNKVFDYMACGRPFIVAIDGTARSLAERSAGGLYSPAEDPESMASAILRLYNDRGEAEAMGRRGREFVVQNYDRNQLAIHYLDQLADIART